MVDVVVTSPHSATAVHPLSQGVPIEVVLLHRLLAQDVRLGLGPLGHLLSQDEHLDIVGVALLELAEVLPSIHLQLGDLGHTVHELHNLLKAPIASIMWRRVIIEHHF